MVLLIRKLLYISRKAAPAFNFSNPTAESLYSKGFQQKQLCQAVIYQKMRFSLKCSSHAAFSIYTIPLNLAKFILMVCKSQ